MKTTIIVVDDDEAARHSLGWLIKSWGYHVLSYDSATSYLRDTVRNGKPACVILDIHMPEINGLELYAMLKKQHPDIAVIFVTGHPNQDLAAKVRKLDTKGFFVKPLDTDALLHCIAASAASTGDA